MGCVIIITGAGRGIGASVARRFLGLGDQVVGLDIADPEEPLDGVTYVQADVTEAVSVSNAFAGFDRVDVLINNAGIQRVGLVGAQSDEDWLKVLATHLHGTYLCSASAVHRMPPGGAIVSIGSTLAFVGMPGRSAYAAAKAGILGFTRSLSLELASRNIRVNVVCPGFTQTRFKTRRWRTGLWT